MDTVGEFSRDDKSRGFPLRKTSYLAQTQPDRPPRRIRQQYHCLLRPRYWCQGAAAASRASVLSVHRVARAANLSGCRCSEAALKGDKRHVNVVEDVAGDERVMNADLGVVARLIPEDTAAV